MITISDKFYDLMCELGFREYVEYHYDHYSHSHYRCDVDFYAITKLKPKYINFIRSNKDIANLIIEEYGNSKRNSDGAKVITDCVMKLYELRAFT